MTPGTAPASAPGTATPGTAPAPGPRGALRHPLARWAPLVIVLAGALAYSNSLTAPFVLDDLSQIAENPAVATLLAPVDWLGLEARPITLVTLRLDHALDRLLGGDGLRTPVYHLTNLLIHLAAALALFGVVRRSVARSPAAPLIPDAAAFAVALLWVVHPLTTQAVTYTIQRGEALASLFILLTLYTIARGAAAGGRMRFAWYALGVLACWLGVLSKQIAIVAPVLALLYDRAFLGRSFAEALRRRWWVYLLLLTPLLALAVTTLLRPAAAAGPMTQASAGFELAKHTPLQYAWTQPRAILQYLRLAVVPYPLVFDYGWSVFPTWKEALPWALGLMPAIVGALVALVRWPRVGFIAASFFLILAPSSSILPIADVIFEYRMYLPLAAMLTLVVLAGAWATSRWASPRIGAAAVGIAAVGLMSLTLLRNHDYRSPEALWLDTTLKAPRSARAHHNLANVYLQSGRFHDAAPAYAQALELEPRNALARTNYAVALREAGRPRAARSQLIKALQAYEGFAPAMVQMGVTARELGDLDEAEDWLARAVAIDPGQGRAWLDLGALRYQRGRRDAAVEAWERAAALGLRSPDLFNNLGLAAAQAGDLASAVQWWDASLQLNPQQPDTRANLERARGMKERRGP